MDEEEGRAAIIREAESWIGTPYLSNAAVKGRFGGGTDCAMLLVAVYSNVGLIPKIDPRPYSPQWHVHRNEEAYMKHVLNYAQEVPGPPERMPKPGDVVMFKLGNVFAHAAIITDWPRVIHAMGNMAVMKDDISRNTLGKRALAYAPQRFFTLWM